MGRSILLAVALLTATLSSCGTQTVPGDGPNPSSSVDEGPMVMAGGEVMVSCGDSEGWPPSVMSNGVHGVLSEAEARRIFEGILGDPRTGGEAALSLFPDGVDADWRVLRQDEKSLTLGLGRWTEQGPAGEDARTLRLEAEGNNWRAAGWGDCQLSPVLKANHARVEVTEYQGDAESTQLTTKVNERDCTSGRNPNRFLHEPLVIESDDSVTIYWTSEPAQGDRNCQRNPFVDRVVELKQPLGTRTVFDGLTYPPRQVPPR